MSKHLIENPLESLSMTIPFSVRDWGQEKCDAWVWGIVCGWSDNCRAEFERKFGWDTATFDRLKRLHARFEEMLDASKSCEKCDIAERDFALSHTPEYATRAAMFDEVKRLHSDLDASRHREQAAIDQRDTLKRFIDWTESTFGRCLPPAYHDKFMDLTTGLWRGTREAGEGAE